MLDTFITTLDFSMAISLSLLYIVASIALMQAKKNSGIYTFRANVQIYHNIRSFGREDGKEPRHLELYFYDDDPSLEHRF